jgi:hypothetical protein
VTPDPGSLPSLSLGCHITASGTDADQHDPEVTETDTDRPLPAFSTRSS